MVVIGGGASRSGPSPASPRFRRRARLATDAAGSDALAALGGRPPLGIIAFDCIARRGVLGDEGIRAEIDRLATIAAGVPVAGFYTYGEIARMRGLRGSHNQTLVVLSIG